ncbi:hypothetical protein [Phormidesmis sp. 146-12]
MGIVWAYLEESRPVPVRKATTSKNKTEPDSLVGESRRLIRLIELYCSRTNCVEAIASTETINVRRG